ncbi:MAG: lysophospholipid acyltransferase family protein [Pseudomonadales bacterium]|jgi:putative hemolysin|nr:lysophospholipid acyltransferase family protein [Pseudomonadales bacterium]
MIDVEAAVSGKFPLLANSPAFVRTPALGWLKRLLHEAEINDFLIRHCDSGFEWIARVFERLDFSYTVSARERANIPDRGRVVIVANHPLGSLDGLALLKLVGEVRRDVKIVANDLLTQCSPLNSLLIPVDNLGGGASIRSFRQVLRELEQERAVIVFPAGEVSRASPTGVKDGPWRPGFLHFARKTHSPVLPIQVQARNSLLFYGASLLFKPIGTLLLPDEMFKQQARVIHFCIGAPIPVKQLESSDLHDRTVVKRLRKHVYKLHKPHQSRFITERTVAHPEPRQLLQQELKAAQLLGVTRDNNAIYLVDWQPDSAVLREIGRLREFSFRKVGEGSGKTRDLDDYDCYYRHLVLWDREALEIAGAYRLGEGKRILAARGFAGFYTNSLFHYTQDILPYLERGVELGRSFVSPAYWGKASLDYLWQGIGAYLAHHPEVQYLLGPVSMSADYSGALMQELVYYFNTYYKASTELASAQRPFALPCAVSQRLAARYTGQDRKSGFALLQEAFAAENRKIPVLFKQYAALFDDDGFQTLVFSRDPDFADCLDGLCMADLRKLKASKRERYVTTAQGSDARASANVSTAPLPLYRHGEYSHGEYSHGE